jgi:hypothetical protein
MERDGGHRIAAMIHFSYTVTGMGLRPVPGDRPLAVVSNRYTSNGLSILPLLAFFTADTCRGSICDVPVP